MADNVAYTAGAGTDIATDQITADSSHAQIVKLAYSADGIKTLIPADASGLDVDVTGVAGNVTVVQATATNLKVDASGVAVPVTDNSGSLTVDAPAATPVFVRLSSGSVAVDTIPVSGTITIQDGAGSITVDGTVAATQSGTWNVGSVASITADVNIADGGNVISVDDGAGSLTVDGTVTVTQGNAGTVGQSWFTKVGDGTITATLTTVGADNGIDVNVIGTVGGGAQTDKTAFTEGSGVVGVASGVYNPTRTGNVADNNAAAVRITALGDLQVSLVDSAGAATGTSGAPLRVDPTGTTEQIVDITKIAGTAVNAAAAGTIKVGITDEAGANFSVSNTFPVEIVTSGAVISAANPAFSQGVRGGAVLSETNPEHVLRSLIGKTPVRNLVAPTASQTAIAIWTPAAGKKFVIEYLIISASTGGVITIFDGTDTSANTIFKATLTTGAPSIVQCGGHPSLTADNVLNYTTGAFVGTILAVGYETA